MDTPKEFKRFRVQVTSGASTGRFVGQSIGGFRSNPDLLKNPEVKVPGTGYSLFVQEGAAFEFFEEKAIEIQAEFKNLGYETALVEVKQATRP